jgi:DNA-binding transcriptional LysR family regulator
VINPNVDVSPMPSSKSAARSRHRAVPAPQPERPHGGYVDNLDDIRFFVRVVESGSFASAARILDMTPVAVSKRVSQLEDNLGVQLFHRSTRKLTLTDVGKDFSTRCSQAIADLVEACNAAVRDNQALRGILKIQATIGVGQILLAPAIREFARKYPEISVTLTISESPAELLEQGFDVMFVDGIDPKSSGISYRKLADVRYLICASPAYIQAHGKPRSPKELIQHNCIIREPQYSANEWRFMDGKKETRVRVDGTFRTNNGIALQEAVLGGLGIGRLPDYSVADDIRRGRLVVLFDNLIGWGRTITAAVPQARHQTARLKAFLDFLESYIRTWDDLKRR